ncbi:hypothetical protein AXE65_01200 [Ventosimonas gracilis]|uniref:OmpA-like domain-containing protein n=1 Tax=Ventosimonas gracilis TaxID=1680762 RepID=A0A139SVS8_9GAMM|nr:OmpA family protein [Ventosimonas gracilis]KXU38541.1 hypothetical protein AXE65_01200 [Ventosimonas gracilis]
MINKTLPLALICALLLASCSSGPSEEQLAAARAADEQAALAQWRLLEQQKTRTFLDVYELRLRPLVSENGLELERREELLSISIPVDSYFNVKRQANTLLPVALPRINELVRLLQEDAESGVLILGHLDPEQVEKTPKLSAQQAQAVASIFRLSGFGRGRALFKGVGADMPRAANDDLEARKLNRRVELLLTRQSVLPHILRQYSQSQLLE